MEGIKFMSLPRVSVMNCVSTALEMLKFSSESLISNAGYDNFDYIVVTWLPSKEVEDYLENLKKRYNFVHTVVYETNPDVAYVPNLRGMMNTGFTKAFEMNEYSGLVNTDQYFGKDWLINLVKYASEDTIVNCTSIQPLEHPAHINVNLGIPEEGKFDMVGFNKIYNEVYEIG